ncbi:discoidin domain-containing protein, partial [bacterium]|nr:discoidin domain-containing protein [bacterium]
MRSSTVASIVAVVVAGILAAGTAHADFIRPSGASASTTYGSGTAPARLIDLAGSIPESLSAESAAATHPQGSGAAGFGQWHSAINDINDGVWVRLDLGKRYDLSQIYIWQGNQTGESDRGVQDFTVEVSKDGSTWTPALGASVLTQSAGGNIPAQTYALSNADGVLHARISGSTNYGDSYTGLSEVRFEGTDQWITPNGVAASSFYGYNQHPDHTIDGSGLSAESRTGTHSTNSSQLWHSGVGYASGGGAPVVDDQWLVYALPGTFDLTDVHFWNMNQSGFTNRSIQDYDLQVSSDGVNWATPLLNDTLNQAGGGAEAVQTRTLSASNVRFVRIDIDTDYSGVANNYVGLSEIRFEGAQVAPGPQIANQFATTGGGLGKPVSSTDLLQGIVATSSLTLNAGAGPLSQLTDGLGSDNFAHRVIATDQANNWVLTFDL